MRQEVAVRLLNEVQEIRSESLKANHCPQRLNVTMWWDVGIEITKGSLKISGT